MNILIIKTVGSEIKKKKKVCFQKIPEHAMIFVVEELPLTSSLSCLQKAPKKKKKKKLSRMGDSFLQ